MFPCLPPEASEWSIWHIWNCLQVTTTTTKSSWVSDIQLCFIKHFLFERMFLAIYCTFMNCQLWDLENSVLKRALQWHKNIQLYVFILPQDNDLSRGIRNSASSLLMLGILKLARTLKLLPRFFFSFTAHKVDTTFCSQENDLMVFP